MTDAERAVIAAAMAWRRQSMPQPHDGAGLWAFGFLTRAVDALNAERAAKPQTPGGGGGVGYVHLRQEDVPDA